MKTQGERGKDWLHITFIHSSTSKEGTSGGGERRGTSDFSKQRNQVLGARESNDR